MSPNQKSSKFVPIAADEGCLNPEEGYKLDHAMPTDTSVKCVLEELIKLAWVSDFSANCFGNNVSCIWETCCSLGAFEILSL